MRLFSLIQVLETQGMYPVKCTRVPSSKLSSLTNYIRPCTTSLIKDIILKYTLTEATGKYIKHIQTEHNDNNCNV